MILSDIKYHSPRTLDEALGLLRELEGARVLAGGTDLLVDLKQGLTEAKNIISLHHLKELKGIERRKDKICIGAMSTAQEILSHSLIREHLPALADAAQSMASYPIRTMATIGGNISSAVPSADLPPPLIAADAAVELRCSDSSREETLASFFSGPRETICEEGELVAFILVPVPPAHTGISFQKFSLREANALAVASVAARITVKDRRVTQAAIILGAVAPTPVKALKTAQFLMGKEPSDSLFDKAASLAAEESQPISDIRGSEWFRKELITVLTRRALKEAQNRASEKRTKEREDHG
ncbi:MAG: FAD binding domain-containing protein [Candidatus Aminicenantes bacterium]